MKVLFVAAESNPFIQTGGLGDVAYALPKALRSKGIDARVILPNYGSIPENFKNQMWRLGEFNVPVGWREQYGGLLYMEYDGVPFYFIDNEYYFKREKPYGYYDDGERFGYFSKAVIESINYMGDFTPDVIHCNDWHTGMIPPILKDIYRFSDRHNRIKTVFTIHNLQFQGVFPKEILSEILNLNEGYFNEDALKFYDGVSFMKGGINFSDLISTVSYSYAQEIKTPFFGEKLDGLLNSRSNDLWGIVNGLDYDAYNPENDLAIDSHFSPNDIQGKINTKLQLQQQLNLTQNADIPMIGIVSRLTKQKGLDLISYVIEELLQQNVQLVVLGTGEEQYENMFKYFAYKYPNKVSANILFNGNLARKIYASSDMFLMPSLFEPCGIGQLIALRYGSIPIVRETGGLRDTVRSYNDYTGEGNGFSFTNYNAHDMLYTIRRAIELYNNKDLWRNLMYRAMCEDNSWGKSAELYIDMYNRLLI